MKRNKTSKNSQITLAPTLEVEGAKRIFHVKNSPAPAVKMVHSDEGSPSHPLAYYLFIGTYSKADENGIFVYRFNSSDGSTTFVSAIAGISNPTSLILSENNHLLFAVSETDGKEGGYVYAYLFNHREGKLKYINQQLSGGKGPCNIAIDKTGNWLFVANYMEGSLSVFSIKKDGHINKANQVIQHYGHSINPVKQDKAHIHCVLPGPDNQALYVADLGMDKVFTYKFDPDTGQLSSDEPLVKTVIPGTGPRHLLFSPDGKYLYLIHEIGGIITVFTHLSGELSVVQTISTVPVNYQGKIWAAEIHFSPDGKFLYASNRDDLNDIVTYSVNIKTGILTYVSRISSMGRTPRNFTIAPDGRYLLVGHRNGNEVVIFRRNIRTGKLVLMDNRIKAGHAVCLRMAPISQAG